MERRALWNAQENVGCEASSAMKWGPLPQLYLQKSRKLCEQPLPVNSGLRGRATEREWAGGGESARDVVEESEVGDESCGASFSSTCRGEPVSPHAAAALEHGASADRFGLSWRPCCRGAAWSLPRFNDCQVRLSASLGGVFMLLADGQARFTAYETLDLQLNAAVRLKEKKRRRWRREWPLLVGVDLLADMQETPKGPFRNR